MFYYPLPVHGCLIWVQLYTALYVYENKLSPETAWFLYTAPSHLKAEPRSRIMGWNLCICVNCYFEHVLSCFQNSKAWTVAPLMIMFLHISFIWKSIKREKYFIILVNHPVYPVIVNSWLIYFTLLSSCYCPQILHSRIIIICFLSTVKLKVAIFNEFSA